ncbi:Golgin candidate [Arachis hypogaea]|nr:Golgin candidate [Arachis hypogaea]
MTIFLFLLLPSLVSFYIFRTSCFTMAVPSSQCLDNTIYILLGKHGAYDEKSRVKRNKDDAGSKRGASAERRAKEERAVHNGNATKIVFLFLLVWCIESSTALARIQVECSSLNQELQDMEARLRREQKKGHWKKQIKLFRNKTLFQLDRLQNLCDFLPKICIELSKHSI